MQRRSTRLQEAFTPNPAPAGRVTPPFVRTTHTTETAGSHRPSPHSGGPLRLLAARLIQEQLVRIGRAAQSVEGDLAAVLHRFAARRAHRGLGYRRLADYLEDRPGLSLSACRRLIQSDRVRNRMALVPAAAAGATAASAATAVTAPKRQAPPATSLFEAPRGDEMSPNGSPAGERRASATDFDVWMNVTRSVREALQPLGPGTGAEGPSPISPAVASRARAAEAEPGLFEEPIEDLAGLDTAVGDRVRRAQALAWRRATLIGAASRHHLYIEFGFASLEDWCGAALGLSAAGARDFLWMERMLALHPAIEDAFRRGRLTWSRSIHAARAARPETERAWVRDARRMPIERLRRAAEAAGPGLTRGRMLGG
jgi:hypothetical protein